MHTYETGPLDREQFGEFTKFFEENIGKEYEVNEDPDFEDKVLVLCFDLRAHEAHLLDDFEDCL